MKKTIAAFVILTALVFAAAALAITTSVAPGTSRVLPQTNVPAVYPQGSNAALLRSVWGVCGSSSDPGTVYQFKTETGKRLGAYYGAKCGHIYYNLSDGWQVVVQQ